MVTDHGNADARHVEARHELGDGQPGQIVRSGYGLSALDRGHVVGCGASLGRRDDREHGNEERQDRDVSLHVDS